LEEGEEKGKAGQRDTLYSRKGRESKDLFLLQTAGRGTRGGRKRGERTRTEKRLRREKWPKKKKGGRGECGILYLSWIKENEKKKEEQRAREGVIRSEEVTIMGVRRKRKGKGKGEGRELCFPY